MLAGPRGDAGFCFFLCAGLLPWAAYGAHPADPHTPEQPVAIVISAASDAKIRRAGFDYPLPAIPGELLFADDTLTGSFSQVITDCRTPQPQVCVMTAKDGYVAGKNEATLACDPKPAVCRLPAVPRQASSELEHIQAIRQEIASLPPGARKDDDQPDVIQQVSQSLGPDDGTPLYQINLAGELERKDQLRAAERVLGDISRQWGARWIAYHRQQILDRLNDKLKMSAAGDSKDQVATLVIGVSQYENPDAKFGNLRYAHRDAQSFAGYLNTLDSRIRASALVNAEATRPRIDQELGILRDKLAAGGTAVVFISGHGFEQSGRAFIAPHDAFRTGEQPTAIEVNRIVDALGGVSRAYLFIDACRNDPSNPVHAIFQQTIDSRPQTLAGPSGSELYALFSAQPGERSVEGPTFCASSGPLACTTNLGHGAFSFYLLSALYGTQRKAISGEALRSQVDLAMQKLPFQQRLRAAGNFRMDNPITPLMQVPPGLANVTRFRPLRFPALLQPAFYRPFQVPQPAPPSALRDVQEQLAPDRITEEAAQKVIADCCSAPTADPDVKTAARIALEEAGQRILTKYLDGDENPPGPGQFQAAATYYSLAHGLLPESELLQARADFAAGRAALFGLINAPRDQRAGIFENASALLTRADAADPGSAYILNALGIGHMEMVQPDGAAAALRDSIRQAPQWAYPRHNLALTWMRFGRPQDAIAEYKTAIASAPDRVYLHFNLALIHQQMNHLKEAEAEYQKVQDILDARNETAGQNRAMLHNARGTLAAQRGRADTAELEYLNADRAMPGMKEARHNLALLKKGRQRIDLLRENVRRTGYFESRVELAAALKQDDAWEEAAREYQQILVEKDDFAAARVELARTYIQLGKKDPRFLESAAQELQKVAPSDQGHWRIWLAKAEAAHVRGNNAEAKKDYGAASKAAVTADDRREIGQSKARENLR